MNRVIVQIMLLCVICVGGWCGNIDDTNNKQESSINRTKNMVENDDIIRGKVGVGFEKGVSQEEAESVLVKYNFEFHKVRFVNAGKVFFYETEQKFIVNVPEGEESKWVKLLRQDPDIKMVVFNYNPNKVKID